MRFLNRVLDSLTGGSRASDRRLATRRRSAFGCEALEGRALLSNIPGVNLFASTIQITATKAGGNVAQVSVDPANHNIKVSLNGQSEEFAASKVTGLTYQGGMSGGDTFVNDTRLALSGYWHGGNNHVTSDGVSNLISLVRNNNTYNAGAYTTSYVYEAGTGDTIHKGTGATIDLTVYPEWEWQFIH